MQVDDFRKGMNVLLAMRLANTPVSDAHLFEAYYLGIGDLEKHQFTDVLRRLARGELEIKFFPSAPELRKHCINDVQLDASAMWNRFRKLCTAYGKEEALRLSEDDLALRHCIDSFYKDFGQSTANNATYWIDIFKKTYEASKHLKRKQDIIKLEAATKSVFEMEANKSQLHKIITELEMN